MNKRIWIEAWATVLNGSDVITLANGGKFSIGHSFMVFKWADENQWRTVCGSEGGDPVAVPNELLSTRICVRNIVQR